MNAISKVRPSPDAALIAHSVLAYDRETDGLDLELPIPLFLDTLALKIAKVPPEDQYGQLSYPLTTVAVDTFRFLLGLSVDTLKREYFLESTAGLVTNFSSRKLEAVELLTKVTSRPLHSRRAQQRISESELVLPTLRLLYDSDGSLSTSEIIRRLMRLFDPIGRDAEILSMRNDTYFSQKVRNMISHRNQPSNFICRGLAMYEPGGLQLTNVGRSAVRALLS